MLVDADGKRYVPPSEVSLENMESHLAAAYDGMVLNLAESMFGNDPEDRVYELRKSILGDDAGPSRNQFLGLSAALNVPVVLRGMNQDA